MFSGWYHIRPTSVVRNTEQTIKLFANNINANQYIHITEWHFMKAINKHLRSRSQNVLHYNKRV